MGKTEDKESRRERALRFLRLESRGKIQRAILGIIIGVIGYILLYQLTLPSYKLLSMITIQFNLAILVIPVIGVFFGPLAGLLVGIIGATGGDALFTQQIIAFGLINLSYGLLGFIAGIPHYKGFSSGRTLAKVILFTIGGLLVMAAIYLVALIEVAGQNMLVTLLYNFLPFINVSFITLFLMTPTAVRLIDALTSYARKRIS
ncbi:MAG: hypothetical protein ABSF36_08925 [Candidatus Methanomethylicaceae archaeon]|jgi:hypothetical protein